MALDINRRELLCGIALLTAGLSTQSGAAVAATGVKILKNGKVRLLNRIMFLEPQRYFC